MKYDPYASPDRARQEEFGDLLAEGLYALIGEGDTDVPFAERLEAATATYWSRFIHSRRAVLAETMTVLDGYLARDPANHRVVSALASLQAAESQLKTITADVCVNFLKAWRADLAEWQTFSNGVNAVANMREAMDFLNVNTWTQFGFGPELASSGRFQRRIRIR
jgi:hypothetical protein